MRSRSPGRRARAAVVLALAAVTLLAGCVSVGMGDPVAGRVGACHALTRPEQFETPSDSAPSVRCALAHTTETFRTGTVPAVFSGDARRPAGEVRASIQEQVCPAESLRSYVGARPSDSLFGLWIVAFLPTQRAWDAGARWVRCDVVHTARDDALEPVRGTGSLERALESSRASALTRCYRQRRTDDGALSTTGTDVSCASPHTSRDVNAWTTTSIRPQTQTAISACVPAVTAYLGAPPAPDAVTVVIEGSAASGPWSVRCAVVEGR